MDNCSKLIIPEVDVDFDLLKENEAQFSMEFDQIGRPASIQNAPWSEFPDKPDVQFRIAWCQDTFLLKYYVREREILGTYTQDGSDVFEDSCVELFLSPEGKESYYNFEFNCIGCALGQLGSQRDDRVPVENTLLDQIIRIPSLGRSPYHNYHEGLVVEAPSWSLMVVIPVSVFFRESYTSFSGLKMRGNLYKCGDQLETPHYLCWNPIESEAPDFHRPEHFGELWFS
ncbi:hypothetical protein EXM22_11180 [Oceanispirochaeta crateris]|uniref:Carbohydrate-binding domain-containing protein n=1 Tax=Oceanispirochaeta crateris TaxID=2518645 RepID=A0A5C1QNG5_9SPIO|nr:carbohydrate-binding family 9-like protein [Oceanispirochaeta crateris]QEN08520.1 hypothetical protein EXM22_11180 [Oceanispirochaeta crateris]